MSFLGIDLHSNRFTVARLVVKDEVFETVASTYTFLEESFRRLLYSLTEKDHVLVENTFNINSPPFTGWGAYHWVL